MKILKNISSVIMILIFGCFLSSCQKSGSVNDEKGSVEGNGSTSGRDFDPLSLATDMIIVPSDNPNSDALVGKPSSSGTTLTDSTNIVVENLPDEIDSLNYQAYRVQLFSSKVYGDARQAVKIAEEIFDRPIVADYEVPYYKVRVGSFSDSDEAEKYMLKAKAAGYSNAWVVIVTIVVNDTKPLHEELMLPGSLNNSDTESDDENSSDE